MKRAILIHFLTAGTLTVLMCSAGTARAEAPPEWDGIRRLQVDLSAQEAGPFVQLAPVSLGDDIILASATQAAPTVQQPPGEVSVVQTASPLASSYLESQKHQLRESLAKDGEESLAGRDQLTSELVGMMRWTVVSIMICTGALVALKKFQRQTPSDGSSSSRMRVLETLALGRQQSLKLVEVGGERFVVASDQGGIKALTMLPSWPDVESEESLSGSTGSTPESRTMNHEGLDRTAVSFPKVS